MKAHVEPLNLQCSIGWGNISSWEKFRDAEHLLKTMEVVHWACEEIFVDPIITARRQVDVLAIA